MSQNITHGRTIVEWDKGRQGWALPGRQITKDIDRAKRAAVIIDRIIEGERMREWIGEYKRLSEIVK